MTVISDKEILDIVGPTRGTTTFSTPAIHIQDRIINAPIILRDFIATNYHTTVVSINFSHCEFNNELYLGEFRAAGNLRFNDCTFNKKIIIADSRNVTFENHCKFFGIFEVHSDADDFDLADFHIFNTFKLNSTFTGELEVKNFNTNESASKPTFILSSASHDLEVNNINADVISIGKLASNGKIVLNDIISEHLFLDGPWDNTACTIKKTRCDKLFVDRISKHSNALIIEDKCIINILHLPLDKFDHVTLSNSSIKRLSFSGQQFQSHNLNIQDINDIVNFSFKNVTNNGTISLRNLKIENEGCLEFITSNLGKTDFIKCEFSKAKFGFLNSKVTETFLSETDFPYEVSLGGQVNHAQSQLAFGQLATAFSKQGDTVRALDYQSREIESHYRGIKWNSVEFFKWASLFLNKWSNNFGRYWQWGLLFSFFVGFFFYYLLLFSSTNYHFAWTFNDVLVSGFLKFMNPLRFLDTEALFKMNDKKSMLLLSGWSYVWDFAGRLFVAYGYYQTIQAFRRFGRK